MVRESGLNGQDGNEWMWVLNLVLAAKVRGWFFVHTRAVPSTLTALWRSVCW